MSYPVRRTPWSEKIKVRGLDCHLTWWGERSTNPIVLLHGYMDNGATWQFLVDCLPEDASFVAPDWRGFGDSEWAADGYWFPDYFADLDVLLDLLVPATPARVIGHSMGANIAKMYAGIRTTRLEWLVNLEGLGLKRLPPSDAPRRYAQWIDQVRAGPKDGRYADVAELAEVLRARNPRLTQERAQFVARAWSRPAENGIRLAFDPRHRLVNPTLYRRDEAEACWAQITIPMLLICGGESDHRARIDEFAQDEQIRAMFRTLQLATVPGVGHMMHHEDPAAVADHIVKFAQAS